MLSGDEFGDLGSGIGIKSFTGARGCWVGVIRCQLSILLTPAPRDLGDLGEASARGGTSRLETINLSSLVGIR
jgi:hypothetical protein